MREGKVEAPMWARFASQMADGSAWHLLAGDGASGAGDVLAKINRMQAQIDAQQRAIDRLTGV
jgi:hypothetical protein